MTGSAYNAMDVLYSCESHVKGRGLGKGWQSDQALWEAGGLPQKHIYIYIYTQNSLFGVSEKERFLERFWRGFWRGFGEVFGDNFDIILIFFLYYSAYRVGLILDRFLD